MATSRLDKTWIDKIDYKNPLGHGGFGYVYTAHEGKEVVAAKVLKKEQVVEKYIEDAEQCLNLPNQHPHILTIYDILEDSENKYVFMEYCEYGNLKTYFHRLVLNTNEKVNLMAQIAEGLSCLHENGIIHRDIKPQNILLKRSGEYPFKIQAKLSDFGLTKFLEDQSTMSSDVGTVAFKAPEFWQRDIDGKLHYKETVDVFAAGLTYLTMLQTIEKGGDKFAPGIEIATSLDPSEQEQSIGYTMYVRMKNSQTVPNIISEEGDEMTIKVKHLVRKMINAKPDDRPSARTVCDELRSILETQPYRSGCVNTQK